MTVTNLLLSHGIGLCLTNKHLHPALLSLFTRSTFEQDTQMNLRVLHLLCRHFDAVKQANNLHPEVSRYLVEFLVDNLNTFRQLFDSTCSIGYDLKQTQAKKFFFEEAGFQLTRMTAVRLSFSMSLQVLQVASAQDSKVRLIVIEHPNSFILFRILQVFVFDRDKNCLEQVKQALSLIESVSETDQTHANWAKFDTIQHMLSVVDKVTADSRTATSRSEVLLPALQTIVNLSRRNGIADFHQLIASAAYTHLMERLKAEEDEQVNECVNELLAALVDFKHKPDQIQLDKKLAWLTADDNNYKLGVLLELDKALADRETKLSHESCHKIFERVSTLLNRIAT